MLVEADNGALTTEFVPLDVISWLNVTADVSGAETIEAAASLFGDALGAAMAAQGGRPCCVRGVLKGRCAVHGRLRSDPTALTANIRAVAADVSGNKAWIEKVQVQTGPVVDLDELAQSDTPQGELLRYLAELATDPREIDLDLTDLKAKLAGSGVQMPREDMQQMLIEAGDLLLTALADAQSEQEAS